MHSGLQLFGTSCKTSFSQSLCFPPSLYSEVFCCAQSPSTTLAREIHLLVAFLLLDRNLYVGNTIL